MSKLLAALVILTGASGLPAPQGPITVSAAISLADVLEEAAAEYAKARGGPVRFNFAGSNVLARQIVNGAPVDVFISADEAQMDMLGRAGAVLSGSRRALVSNQLAVVALPGRLAEIRDGFPRAAPAIRRLVNTSSSDPGLPSEFPFAQFARLFLLVHRGQPKRFRQSYLLSAPCSPALPNVAYKRGPSRVP